LKFIETLFLSSEAKIPPSDPQKRIKVTSADGPENKYQPNATVLKSLWCTCPFVGNSA